MKTVQVNKRAQIVCQSEKTRYGFRHLATLLIDGREVAKDKACYYNRTWESYEFESVIHGVLQKTDALTKRQKNLFLQRQRKKEHGEVRSNFRTVATVAALGEVFTQGKQEANDWKLRMLKAGLPGLDVPEDWDSLSEEQKQERLDAVIKVARGDA